VISERICVIKNTTLQGNPFFSTKKQIQMFFSRAALRFKPISLLPPKRRTRRSKGRSVAEHRQKALLMIRNKVEWVLGKVLFFFPFVVGEFERNTTRTTHASSLSRLLIKRASHFCACILLFVFLSKLVRFVSSLVAFIRAALLSSFFCKC